ncbi:hypothetical protein Tco_0549611 [Tanacetum coccineum]
MCVSLRYSLIIFSQRFFCHDVESQEIDFRVGLGEMMFIALMSLSAWNSFSWKLNIRVILLTVKKEILLEPTSNKLMVEHAEFDESNANVLERFYTSAGNPVKEILLKLNLPDHRILKDGGEVKEFQRSFRHSDIERLSRSDEVLKLKYFKKDATLKLFKSTNQERYEHVGPEVTSSQDGEMRLCLVDDLKVFKITFKTS